MTKNYDNNKQILTDLLTEIKKRGVKLWLDGETLRYKAPKGVITDEILKNLRERKDEIIKHIQIEKAKALFYEPIELVEEKAYYPMSAAQKRMFIVNQIDKANKAYNLTQVLKITGEFDKKHLEHVIQQLIRRHESLRTSFDSINGDLVQKVHGNIDFNLDYQEIEGTQEQVVEVINEYIRPYDLTQAPLFRIKLVKLIARGRGDGSIPEFLIIFDMHHIISDGISIAILVNEINRLYINEPLPDLKIQYKDYAAWHEKLLSSEVVQNQKDYWLDKFQGEIPILNLPTDNPRPGAFSFRGSSVKYVIDKDLSGKLHVLAGANRVTLFTVLIAAYYVLLAKYSGQSDIIVGTPVAGRRHADLQGIIGVFVNTLALRNYPESGKTFQEFLKEVESNVLKAFDNQDYPFEQLVDDLGIQRDISRNPLYDTMLVLQNMNNQDLSFGGAKIAPYDFERDAAQMDLVFNATESDGNIEFKLEYCSDLFVKETIDRIAAHFINILKEATKEPHRKLSDIDMLSEEEKSKILYAFNDTKAEHIKDKALHQLFEEQAARTPDNIAVICEDKQLTYKELNERSNQLAGMLRAKGVKPDRIVGIMTKRPMEMVAGIIAILKAGGAYLPIDPEYPKERIEYMLQDSNACILMTQMDLMNKIKVETEILDLKDNSLYSGDNSNLNLVNTAHDLAYVIYTSGTTGNPKGVMIEHKGISNTIQWRSGAYQFDGNDSVLQLFSYSFDGFLTSFFTPIVSGAKVILPTDTRDASAIKNCIVKYRVTHFIAVPALYAAILERLTAEEGESLRIITLAGDKAAPGLIEESRRKLPWVELVNEYGPSENSVATTIYRNMDIDSEKLIGKPIVNTKVFILSPEQKIQPIGVPGELCISGIGLARGYLNQPELTVKKFVPNPFSSGHYSELMYKTGDLARWLPDGNIEFLGRMDHQVKIRGFRIELGEIESALLKHEMVKEALVIDREDQNGYKYLCAYIVVVGDVHERSPHACTLRESVMNAAILNGDASDFKLNPQELRTFLLRTLPDYMVPAYFVTLEKLPLNANGKVNRKALPVPDRSISTWEEYEAPANEIEDKLVKVWREVLGLKKVGVNDSFFELGGDSIKAIQISSRLNKYGMALEIKDLFANPRIRELAKFVKLGIRLKNQDIIEGESPLTPIQKWFFRQELSDNHHFNQSVMLYRKDGFDEAIIRKVFTAIIKHHDALRMVYRMEGDGIVQYNRGIDGNLFDLSVMNLANEKEYARKVEEECERIQGSINLNTGPLVKLGLFKTSGGDHLLIVIHHLVIDGVSWRILLEDLALGYEQAKKGAEVRFQDKTDSYREWAIKLNQYAKSEELYTEANYWKKIAERGFGRLKKDGANMETRESVGDLRTVSFELGEAETKKLLTNVNHAYNTEINDILLTALGMAVKENTGIDRVLVALEGHGREGIIEGIDISRTIGWFTSVYPVILDMNYTHAHMRARDIAYQIKAIKEGLREIPQKGVGYGILKYLTDEGESPEFNLEPEISFNYLGRFDSEIENKIFNTSDLSPGASVSKKSKRRHAIEVNGMIIGGKLVISLSFCNEEYKESFIRNIANSYHDKLHEIIDHCAGRVMGELTPSDLSSKGISIQEIDEIYRIIGEIYPGEIQDIYYLTPMQQGMLFHYIMDRESAAYFQQLVFTIKGELEKEWLERSLELVVARRDILRTVFLFEGLKKPLQVVLKERKVRIDLEDLTGEQDKEAKIKEIKEQDKKEGFDLSKDILMRVKILKTGEGEYRLIWSFHHIIMDGWCIGIITKEIFEIYTLLRRNNGSIDIKAIGNELGETYSYGIYIKWLENQRKEDAKKYWKKYLEGYEQQSVLPKARRKRASARYIPGKIGITIEEPVTNRLREIGRENQVTLNSLIQVIWGVLLQKYNNTNDVVFGYVVSGRPPGIKGIENILGLFINTVPVRIRGDGEQRFDAIVRQTQAGLLNTRQYEHISLAEIQAGTELKQGLIDHIMIFENYPVETAVRNAGENIGFTVEGIEAFEQTNYDFDIIVLPRKEIKIELRYNESIYERDMVERIAGHIREITLSIAAKPDITLNGIEMLTAKEKHQILHGFNNTAAQYPKDKTIHRLFEEQAERTPEIIAVIFEDQKLTYKELNEKANRLASLLRAKGAKPDSIIAIMVERSPEMIIGIMGILKSGGAYLPIDPDYPAERIRYMLEDSGANILLTKDRFIDKAGVNSGFYSIILLEKELYHESISNLEYINSSKDLAYIIYTSGSTGKPKGVMIEHYSLINRLNWMQKKYPIGEDDVILQKTPYTFDVSLWELFWWSIQGAKVCFLKPGGEKDPGEIVDAIEKNGITTIHFVPSMLNLFLEYVEERKQIDKIKSLRQVFASGEALTEQQVKKFNDLLYKKWQIKLYNLYGPTEATVDVSYFDCSTGEEFETIPIGKPIDNINLYVLDKNNKLQPVGIPGELHIAGDGLARGYLNRPDLTAEKFIPNPFCREQCSLNSNQYTVDNEQYISGEYPEPEQFHTSTGKRAFILQTPRMYKTGDLARWLPDGNIEFLGRIDHQVKIRGNRIELGEIEARLQRHEGISEAVVIAKEDKDGNKYLCAYIVVKEAYTHIVNLQDLRTFLLKELPEYMIPAYFVKLDKLPLTPNGKLDRKALVDPDKYAGSEAALNTGVEYEAPADEAERKLVEIWQEVLGLEKIGVNDSFFALGGDSIKAIQVLARLSKYNMKLEIKDLFANPRIRELKKCIKTGGNSNNQGIIEGEAPLTPIQRWFFEVVTIDKHYFNQAVMLYKKDRFDETIIRKVFTAIVTHHDALRMVYRTEGDRIVQYNRGIEGNLFDLSVMEIPEHEYGERVVKECERIQSSMNLNTGPLVKLGLFKTTAGDHLLIAIHHLVIDGVSWRIILEDLALGYEQAKLGEEIKFQDKTGSYREWALKLHQYIQREELFKNANYWRKIAEAGIIPLKKDREGKHGGNEENRMVVFELGETETNDLLQRVNQAYNTEINDILLTALGMAVKAFTGEDRVLIALEGHGREEIMEGIDISRTVGWFTSLYPVVLDMSHTEDIAYQVKTIKESLREIPQKGIDYGILKYLTDEGKKPEFNLQPELRFNYLGQFHREIENGIFEASILNPGPSISKQSKRQFAIDINGMIIGGKLVISIDYANDEFKKSDMDMLAGCYKEKLAELIKHCVERQDTELTPSDLSSKGISLDEIEEVYNILGKK